MIHYYGQLRLTYVACRLMIHEAMQGVSQATEKLIELLEEARAKVLAAQSRATGSLVGTAAEKAARIRDLREQRYKLLDEDLLGEPAWDMLLDVFIAEQQKGKLSIKAVSSTDHVAPTTGLRYIALLVEKGLLARVPDEDDGRRYWITLTDRSRKVMQEWLALI